MAKYIYDAPNADKVRACGSAPIQMPPFSLTIDVRNKISDPNNSRVATLHHNLVCLKILLLPSLPLRLCKDSSLLDYIDNCFQLDGDNHFTQEEDGEHHDPIEHNNYYGCSRIFFLTFAITVSIFGLCPLCSLSLPVLAIPINLLLKHTYCTDLFSCNVTPTYT